MASIPNITLEVVNKWGNPIILDGAFMSYREINAAPAQPCGYCGSASPDDRRGNCAACGAPRKQRGPLGVLTTDRQFTDADVERLRAAWSTGVLSTAEVRGIEEYAKEEARFAGAIESVFLTIGDAFLTVCRRIFGDAA